MKKSIGMKLQHIVLEILHSVPEGLNHVQLVRLILDKGYRHPEGQLSEDIMKIVKHLVKHGVLRKNLETRKIYEIENGNHFNFENHVRF